MKSIHLWGVKQNNLKDIEVKIPLGSFTVICGPSGSGKSSLAFETLFAEGQRRYIESLSNYSKQFLNKAPKPDIEGIENIPPAISIEQKNSVKSSRSTVGTVTEVVDYLRLLYEKIGHAYCPHHHIELQKDSPVTAAKKVLTEFLDDRGYILVKIDKDVRVLKGKQLYAHLLKEGFVRIYKPKKDTPIDKKIAKSTSKKKTTKVLNEAHKENRKIEIFSQIEMGEFLELTSPKLRKTVPSEDFYLVIDRLAFKADEESRLIDSLSQAYRTFLALNSGFYSGHAEVITTEGKRLLLDERHSCSICGYEFPPISARLFSFNSPVGACSTCNGFGNTLAVDEDKVVPDKKLTLAEGAIKPFAMPSSKSDKAELRKFCKKAKIDWHTPWNELTEKERQMIWQGTDDFYGVLGFFEYLESKKYKMHVRVFLARHKSPIQCPECKGSRLRKEAMQVLVHGHSVTELEAMTLENLAQYFDKMKLTKYELEVCEEIFRQLKSRLKYLNSVGVGYLTLDRETKTLSGGEFQRLNLANQLGRQLSQTLYVLDEPTVGLHPRDNDRLIEVLKELNQLGNTLVVVEHDHDVILASSHIIEMGPGSGYLGGQIIYNGTKKDFFEFESSQTAPYLKPNKIIQSLEGGRPVDIDNYKYKIELKGCTGNNLKNIDVAFPLNRLVTVTGVSGSGKSSLVSHTLYPAVAKELKVEFAKGHEFSSISGIEYIKNVLYIDQSPVGKTARSCPATYMKVFDLIRQAFSSLPESKAMGYTPGTFSLNVDGGRCPSCKGLGSEIIDMMFMDDIEITCDICDGKKYRKEILEITYKKKNIFDVLNLTVQEAMDFFVSYPNIRRPLSYLKEVGLEYLTLGQSANSLSGGESQRLKVAKELSQSQQRNTLFILDEPTTGLHFREVNLLLTVLGKLIDAGGSVILIEHNLEVIKKSDYVIDIGPEAGAKGGKVVATGTPAEVALNKKGHTGKYLKTYCHY